MIDKAYTLLINNNVTVNAGDKTILFRPLQYSVDVKHEGRAKIAL